MLGLLAVIKSLAFYNTLMTKHYVTAHDSLPDHADKSSFIPAPHFFVHELLYWEQREGHGCNTSQVPQANAKAQCKIIDLFIRFLAKEYQIVTLFYLVLKEDFLASTHHHLILRINFVILLSP